jgi:hypothetical protein
LWVNYDEAAAPTSVHQYFKLFLQRIIVQPEEFTVIG